MTPPPSTPASASSASSTPASSPVAPSTPPAHQQPSAAATNRAGTAAGTAPARAEEKSPLFAANESRDLRVQWDSIQVTFVDDPRNAVQKADALVSETTKRLSEVFASERQKLEEQWGTWRRCFHRRSSCCVAALPFVLYAASRDLMAGPRRKANAETYRAAPADLSSCFINSRAVKSER